MSTPVKKLKLIIILGPTASGKSDLAVSIAKRFNGEIISVDSRQVYRGMDVGTGKITQKEMRGIPHYLLDVASPKRRFTVAQYKKLAQKTIKKILAKGKVPIICGGTGFYVQAVAENLEIPAVKPDLKLRARLEKKSAQELFGQLKKLDPNRARNIDRFNRRRLIRALEIIKKTGKPIPEIKASSPYDILYLGIEKTPAELKKLIVARLQKRLKQGMIEEVKKLRAQGLSWQKLDDFGLEYRWIAKYLKKQISREVMILRLQKEIEHYAKRQMTWFKRNKLIRWVGNKTEVQRAVINFLKR